ncbi:MAG: hypothetical protein K9N38_07670 [Candidatus Marinimicrobia bacterium]|nr:hypothetical protein [Candidatus Neomarinimicrobiota bacterium]MCF7851050.1 hypothetical protein [Candidatus Neomarinimicrobiota bacterium]
MKYLLSIGLMSVILFACGGQKDSAQTVKKEQAMHEGTDHAMADGEQLIYYTCPMESHKHIHSREPGKCPECNMVLVEGVVTSEDKMEYWGCPMLIHSHIRHAEPGTCAECKMKLKPMRLKTQETEADTTSE